MKKSFARTLLRTIGVFILITGWGSPGHAEQKTIHLRNKTIVTESPGKSSSAQKTEAAVSGLFLIQFNGPFQPEWRKDLQKNGVHLLRFVPEDAFVARFKNVHPGELRAHPFIQLFESYRAEYKVHASLLANAARAPAPDSLPVSILLSPDATPQESAQLRRMLRKLQRESAMRFGNILQGDVTPAQLDALAQSPAVLWIEPAPKIKLFDEIASKITGGDDGISGTPTLTQQFGFDGTGVKVAVADSGLQEGDSATMHPDLAGRVDAFFHYGLLTDAADEHSHGTHVTGIIAGNAATGEVDENGYLYGLGVAPGAHIIAQRIFDGQGAYEAPPTFETLTHDAVRAGAVIGSNSWGDDTQGRYDLSAAEFDELVRDADAGVVEDQQYILEFSAGNAGPGERTIGSPAVAKNVIASGAVENNRFDLFIYDSGQETMADFSSRGPCEDGRIKPDVVAPGTWIASLRSSLANDDNAWAPISENYLYQGGTSQSGPHVSGAAAVFVQYYRQTVTNVVPSPALVKATLINSAVGLDDGNFFQSIPNNDAGWGRVDLTEIIGSPRRYEFVDQTVRLTNNQIFEKRVLVASPDEPLKITLVYSDVPGFPAAIPALVNDLDLEVIAPDGRIYHGNQFENGESVPGATSYDNINNVEAAHLSTPLAGEYIVRVRARSVIEDARRDTPLVDDQDFALVASGDIPLPGVGVLFFDKKSFTAPGTMKLKLIDQNLAGQLSVTVRVDSTTEPNGENVILAASGSSGSFTNNVATATNSVTVDGKIQIAHNDTIFATYQDASPAGIRQATARADLLPPALSNISATNR
ncbi:MAG: S8 family serine peptidase, partial [Verrucomicrobiota bacterium]